MDESLFDQIRLFLPPYLNPTNKRALFQSLQAFPENHAVFWEAAPEGELLQGDCWEGFVVLDFETADRRSVKGLVLSNSCDVAPENKPDGHAAIVFTPLLNLQGFADLLLANGKTHEQVESQLAAIRKQHVTAVFYLPAFRDLPESIVLLDDVHSQPLGRFLDGQRSRVFALNQYGFYIFLLKLSMHFCRFQEAVQRFDAQSDENGQTGEV